MTNSNAERSQQAGREMAESIVYIRVRCSDRYSEWFLDDKELIELAIENTLSVALLEVFGNVEVENVTVQRRTKNESIVHIRFRCTDKYSEWFVDDAELTELAIESIVGPALLEVFDDVQFENVTVQPCAKRDDGDGGQGSTRRENAMR